MARYKIILAYDGTNFHGSQRQAETRTVQLVVETALRKLNWHDQSVLFSGRTDTGVHASGQVVAFDLDWKHSLTDLRNALNSVLPSDTSVSNVEESHPEFHPRFDAISRKYRYRIYTQPNRDPLRDRYTWRVWPLPNLDQLQKAAEALIGVHDFASFGRPTNPGGRTIRDLIVANWQQTDDELIFEVTANAFLYHMVRRLVFVQVQVGHGKMPVAEMVDRLNNPDGTVIQGLAPPQGLSLIEVKYPSDRRRE